jgi:outer membrane lipopolysaccharide assembly protein LptE/RlpB
MGVQGRWPARICDNHLLMSSVLPLLRTRILALLGSAALSATGCGYHGAGAAVHLPRNVHMIDVPTFHNSTNANHVEVTMTQAVLQELTSRTSYRVSSSDDTSGADAVIHGNITNLVVYPLTYDSTTNQSSSFLVTVTARVSVVDRDNRVLYKNDSYVFRQQYETTQDLVSFIQEDSAAVQRLSRDFAENLVAEMLESF